MVYPQRLHDAMLKIQDTLPTHASTASQQVALAAIRLLGPEWVRQQVDSLQPVRTIVWQALQPLRSAGETWPGGSTRLVTQPRGAFYYLLPIPPGVSEEVAVGLLAREYGLLLLPGSAFGAPGHLRLSYGGLAGPSVAIEVANRLRNGLGRLCRLSVA
jgi:katanin p60 ATPase-containing subunit A1